MNKFKFYIVAAVLASGMTLTSCGDSFLNPDPASKGAAGAAGDPMNINHLFILVTFKAMIFGKVVVMLKMVCQV